MRRSHNEVWTQGRWTRRRLLLLVAGDDVPTAAGVRRPMAVLEQVAGRRRSAIGIGHPHPATHERVAQRLPGAASPGVAGGSVDFGGAPPGGKLELQDERMENTPTAIARLDRVDRRRRGAGGRETGGSRDAAGRGATAKSARHRDCQPVQSGLAGS